MSAFKVGDKVRMKINRNRETDFLADLQSCLSERDISGRAYDALVKAIEDRKTWEITFVSLDSEEQAAYEVKIHGTKTAAPFMVSHKDLEAA